MFSFWIIKMYELFYSQFVIFKNVCVFSLFISIHQNHTVYSSIDLVCFWILCLVNWSLLFRKKRKQLFSIISIIKCLTSIYLFSVPFCCFFSIVQSLISSVDIKVNLPRYSNSHSLCLDLFCLPKCVCPMIYRHWFSSLSRIIQYFRKIDNNS